MEEVSASAKTPADFLKSIKGKPVVVKLNSGVDYRGGSPGVLLRRCWLLNCCLTRTIAGGAQALKLRCMSCRNTGMLGWVHEHSDGADRGARRGSLGPALSSVCTKCKARRRLRRSMSTGSSRTSTGMPSSGATTVRCHPLLKHLPAASCTMSPNDSSSDSWGLPLRPCSALHQHCQGLRRDSRG